MKTATEVQMEESVKKNQVIVYDTLKEIQKTLMKLNDLITILVNPMYTISPKGNDNERQSS